MTKKVRLIKPFPVEDGCGDIISHIPAGTVGEVDETVSIGWAWEGCLALRFDIDPGTLFVIPESDLEIVEGAEDVQD
jgi:hypothetical protein